MTGAIAGNVNCKPTALGGVPGSGHEVASGAICEARLRAQRRWFQCVTYRIVETGPETREMRPVKKNGKIATLYLCREQHDGRPIRAQRA